MIKIEVEIDQTNPQHIEAAATFMRAIGENTHAPYEKNEEFKQRTAPKAYSQETSDAEDPDDYTIPELREVIVGLSDEELRHLEQAEKDGKNRKTALEAIDREWEKREESTSETEEPTVKVEDLRALARPILLAKDERRAQIAEKLKSYGVDTVPNVPEDKREEFAAFLQEIA